MKNNYRISVLLPVLLLISLVSICYCEDYTPRNIWGGKVLRVTEAPGAPGTFYAATQGVFKSIDGGHTWTRKPFPLDSDEILRIKGPGDNRLQCMGVAVSYANPNIIIAGTDQYAPLWRSVDGGDNWAWVDIGSADHSLWRASRVVKASKYDTNVFLAALEKTYDAGHQPTALYISRDAGINWTEAPLATGAEEGVTDILQVPSGSVAGRILVAKVDTHIDPGASFYSDTGAVYYSSADAMSFSSVTFSSADGAPYSMTWDAANSIAWLITSKGKIFSSTDGITWTDSGFTASTLSEDTPYKIYYFAGPTPALFAFSAGTGSDNNRVYKNTSAGFPLSGWVTITPPGTGSNKETFWGPTDICVDSRDTTGNSWGLSTKNSAFVYTVNNGVDFTESTGVNTAAIDFGIKDPATNRIFALSANRVMYSPDNGDTWSKLYPLKGPGDVNYITLHSTDTSRVYLVRNESVIYTDDNGADNFEHTLASPYIAPLSSSVLTNLLVHPSNPDVMFIGILNQGLAPAGNYLYKSTDAGSTWNLITTLTTNGIYFTQFSPSDPNTIYACCGNAGWWAIPGSTGNGLYKSSDLGATWAHLGLDGYKIHRLALDPDNPDRIWAGVGAMPLDVGNVSTQRTEDGGATWTRLRWQKPQVREDGSTYMSESDVLGCQVFYYKPTLYLCPWGGYLLKSDDGGDNTTMIVNLPGDIFWVFSGSLYAATGNGLFSVNYGLPKAYSGNDVKIYSSPNPFNPRKDNCLIRLAFKNAVSSVKLRITTLSGAVVGENDSGGMIGGYSYAFIWDGKNKDGALCAPGLYIATANVDGKVVKNKIVLVR